MINYKISYTYKQLFYIYLEKIKYANFYFFGFFISNMTEIYFTSTIIPMKLSNFHKITSSFRDNFVDYPWTISTSRVANDVFTHNICDCSACLITNGQKALLKHLCPDNEQNHIFKNVLFYLRNNFDLKDKNLQAVLVGSKNTKSSQDIWNKFTKLLSDLEIPTTFLKNGKSPTHLAYRSCTDEVLISNQHIDTFLKKGINKKDTIKGSFMEVKIAPCDEI